MRLTPRRITFAAITLSIAIASAARAQGTLVGYVREDSTGRPVAGALIDIEAVKKRAVSDSSGHYVLAKVPGGLHQVRVRQIGYYPSAMMIRLIGNETRESDLVINRVTQDLDPVRVVAAGNRPVTNVGLAGFEERRRLGFGKFIDSTTLRVNEQRRLADFLGDIPGVRMVPQMICRADGMVSRQRRAAQQCRADNYRRVAMNSRSDGIRTACPMRVILDDIVVYQGMDSRDQFVDWEGTFDVNSVPTSSLVAVEVYRTRAEYPAAYGGAGLECGVLMLWTRH